MTGSAAKWNVPSFLAYFPASVLAALRMNPGILSSP
jgi:hypothetical protein